MREFSTRNNKSVAGLTEQAMQILEHYNWPGNVRELRNVMERATIVAKAELIEPGRPAGARLGGAPAPLGGAGRCSRPARRSTRPNGSSSS